MSSAAMATFVTDPAVPWHSPLPPSPLTSPGSSLASPETTPRSYLHAFLQPPPSPLPPLALASPQEPLPGTSLSSPAPASPGEAGLGLEAANDLQDPGHEAASPLRLEPVPGPGPDDQPGERGGATWAGDSAGAEAGAGPGPGKSMAQGQGSTSAAAQAQGERALQGSGAVQSRSVPLGHLRCGHVDPAEEEAIAEMLLLALAEAAVERRKGDMFPRPMPAVAQATRKELCAFLDTLGPTQPGTPAPGFAQSPLPQQQQQQQKQQQEQEWEGREYQLRKGASPILFPLDDTVTARNVQQAVRHTLQQSASADCPGQSCEAPAPAEGTGEESAPAGAEGEGLDRGPGAAAEARPQAGAARDGGTGQGQRLAVRELNRSNVEEAVMKTLQASALHSKSAVSVLDRHAAMQERAGSSRRFVLEAEQPAPMPSFEGGAHSAEGGEQGWTPPALRVAPLVQAHLEAFLGRQRSLLSRISSALGGTNRAAVDEAAGELRESQLWAPELRRDLARVLLQRLDAGRVAHCGREFLTEKNLMEHEPLCWFRPILCGNAPCRVRLALMQLAAHDAACPHKLLPCSQGCSEGGVPRGRMALHCRSTCPMRTMECPYAGLPGCPCAPMLQRDLEQHCQEQMAAHQRLMLHALLADREERASFAKRLDLLEKAQELQERALDLEVRSLTGKVGEACSKAEAANKAAQRGLQDWKQQHAQIKREAAALKKQMQGLIKG